MRVIILGAGVMGVTSAYFLAKKGMDVTVIDRHDVVAAECSHANGGQLSYSHMEPWANPGAVPKILKWLGKKDAPLQFHFPMGFGMWQWGLQFLQHCSLEKCHETTRLMLELSHYSRDSLHELLADMPITFDYGNAGILHIYRYQYELEDGLKQAEFQGQFGCAFQLLSREECLAKEPSLTVTAETIVGGIWFPKDETGNAHDFTCNLATALTERGKVTFQYNTEITGFEKEGGVISGVLTAKGKITGDVYLLCLGAYSPVLAKQLGVSLPIYPMKGYSITIPVTSDNLMPRMSVTDQSKKIVYSPFPGYVRVAGTAEFAGYNTTIREDRIAGILRQVRMLFPQFFEGPNGGAESKISSWACLRPSTPSGRPLLGKTSYSNLYLNTGHGTLGWTLACGSAKLVSAVIAGEKPDIDVRHMMLKSAL